MDETRQIPAHDSVVPSPSLQPMGWGASLLYFGVPAAALFLCFHLLLPALIGAGMLPFYAYSVALGLPLAGLLTAALVAYRREGNRLTWTAVAARYRLQPLTPRDWLWTISGAAAALALFFLVQPLTARLVMSGVIPLPHSLPQIVDPRAELTAVAYAAAAGGLQGNWGFLLTSLFVFAVNILGEELWWRGYVLPRQELAFGRHTWLVHGLLWTLFHAAMWWNLLNLLPLCLGLSFVASRRQSTHAGIVTHMLHKLDFFLVTLPFFFFGAT